MPSNPEIRKFHNKVFEKVATFVHKQTVRPEESRLFRKAKIIACSVYMNGFMYLDDQALISEAAEKAVKYILRHYDPSKKTRPSPKTTRAERLRRDDEIVTYHTNSSNSSIEKTALHFNVKKSIVQRALEKGGVTPRKLKRLLNLSPHAQYLIGSFEESAPGERMFVFPPWTMRRFIDTMERLGSFVLTDVITEINHAELGICVYLSSGSIVIGRGRKFEATQLESFAKRALDPNNNLYIQNVVSPLEFLRPPEYKGKLGTAVYCLLWLSSLVEHEAAIVENLWLTSFAFADRIRIQMILRRAFNTESGFYAIRTYAAFEPEIELINRAIMLTNLCRFRDSDSPDSLLKKLQYWLTTSDILNIYPQGSSIVSALEAISGPIRDDTHLDDLLRKALRESDTSPKKVEPVPVEKELSKSYHLLRGILEHPTPPLNRPSSPQRGRIVEAGDHGTEMPEEDTEAGILESDARNEAELRRQLDIELGDELGPAGWADCDDYNEGR